MLTLDLSYSTHAADFEAAGIDLPRFDVAALRERTGKSPVWVHFGAGNIFRSFIADALQDALDSGEARDGVIAAESFDGEIIDRVYRPYDNLSISVLMRADGGLRMRLLASVTESLKADFRQRTDWERLVGIFRAPTLRTISLTITEKGYALEDANGELLLSVRADYENGPGKPTHTMSVLASLLYERYCADGASLAVVSMDNCPRNGERLQRAVRAVAGAWAMRGFVEKGFLDYLDGSAAERRVSFPWTMIDKITPHPAESVQKALLAAGLKNMDIVVTSKTKSVVAPFVNAEAPGYLVIEDDFPAGRPPLASPGIFFADRETVEKAERMKVGTCLNPLHTALAIFGCLLGYDFIWQEMRDPDLRDLVERLAFTEGMPVVVDPGVLNPEAFAREVIDERLANPNIPDSPKRIATDTSQKVGIRFGGTLAARFARPDYSPDTLVCIPLAIAAWFRYLLGVDDRGDGFTPSPDPMLDALRAGLSGVAFGAPASYTGQLIPFLKNRAIFGVDLEEMGLSGRIEALFLAMIEGPGSVRRVLHDALRNEVSSS